MNRFKWLVFILCLSVFIARGELILFIGDSITDGNWGSPNKYPCSSSERNLWDKNHILGHGYPEMTAGYFMGNFPDKDYQFLNRGISGETLFQIADRWEKDAMQYSPDIISLLCGTNDVHYWLEKNPDNLEEFDFNRYRIELDSLVRYTLDKNPQIRFVLCTPFVAKAGSVGSDSNFELRKAAVDSIAKITREIASSFHEKISLVDFNSLLDELLIEKPSPEYWMWDGIHPTTAMHYRMSKLWIEKAPEPGSLKRD